MLGRPPRNDNPINFENNLTHDAGRCRRINGAVRVAIKGCSQGRDWDGQFCFSAAPPSRHQWASAALSQIARSEEHTSELQSLMRISYAVFCLKQTNTQIHTT